MIWVKNILITGRPRCGKTTMIVRMIGYLNSAGGFFTQELLSGNQRIGFRIVTLEGEIGILAKRGFRSIFRLGRYGINLRDLDDVGVAAIEKALENKEVVIIDEIGKMELFSQRFRRVVLRALDSNRRVLGTIQQSEDPFLRRIRLRRDTAILELRLDNQEAVFRHLREVFYHE